MPRFSARNAVVALNILLLTALAFHLKYEIWDKNALTPNFDDPERRTAVVVASQASENATWLEEYFPSWEKNIYRVDDADAPLTVPKNKGRESMVYLTYVSAQLEKGGLGEANVEFIDTS
jgi:hypothetical protein